VVFTATVNRISSSLRTRPGYGCLRQEHAEVEVERLGDWLLTDEAVRGIDHDSSGDADPRCPTREDAEASRPHAHGGGGRESW
jgi:hypothetical protein